MTKHIEPADHLPLWMGAPVRRQHSADHSIATARLCGALTLCSLLLCAVCRLMACRPHPACRPIRSGCSCVCWPLCQSVRQAHTASGGQARRGVARAVLSPQCTALVPLCVGWLHRILPGSTLKHLVSTVVGAFFCWFVVGWTFMVRQAAQHSHSAEQLCGAAQHTATQRVLRSTTNTHAADSIRF